LVNLVCSADRLIIAMLLEPIKRDLHLTDTQMGVLSGMAYAIFNSVALVPIGMLADRFSRRKVIATCLILWSAMTAFSSRAQSFMQLLLLRILVGVGEAGNSAPGVSLLADYFPVGQRARALSVFFMASSVGMLATFTIGAWIADHYGWRSAILAAGAPGLGLALVLWLTVKDPPRRESGSGGMRAKPASLTEIKDSLIIRRSVIHTIVGAGLINFVAAGVVTWASAFLIRSHHLSVGVAGTLVAITACAGVLGAFTGGKLCDRYAKVDARWYGWISGTATLLLVVPLVGFLVAQNLTHAIAWYGLFGLLQTVYLGPSYSLIQTVTPPRMRATVNSFSFLLSGIFGFGLGSAAVGALSDRFGGFGGESLRYSLLLISVVLLLSAFHFYRAVNTVRTDVALIPDDIQDK
jgi:MFS family permease